MKKIFLLILILVVYACTREHSNIFDKDYNGSPDAPDSLQTEINVNGFIEITWQDKGNDTGFEVWRKFKGQPNFVKIAQTSPESVFFTDTSLVIFDTTYVYKIVSILPNGKTAESKENITFVPFQPLNLRFFQVSASEVRLFWDDVCKFEDGYIVELREQGGGNYQTIGNISPNDTTFLATNLFLSTNYSLSVKTKFLKNNQEILSKRLEKGFVNNLSAPSSLVASQQTDSKILIAWQDNTQIESGYKVFRSIDSLNFNLIGSTSAFQTSEIAQFADTSFVLDSTYHYLVRAFGGQNELGEISDTITIKPDFPSPKNFAINIDNQNQITLNWSTWNVDSLWAISGFKVQRREKDGDFFDYQTLSSETNSLVYTELNETVTYGFRVAAFTEKNISDFSFRKTIKYTPTNYSLSRNLPHNGQVNAFAVNSIETKMATASEDGLVTLWNLIATSFPQTFIGHTKTVIDVNFSTDNGKIISSSSDSTFKVWSIASGTSLFEKKMGDKVTKSILSRLDSLVITGGQDNVFSVWSIKGDSLQWSSSHEGVIVNLFTDNNDLNTTDSKILITQGFDRELKVWDLETKTLSNTKTEDEIIISSDVKFDKEKIATGSQFGKITFWDLKETESFWTQTDSLNRNILRVKLNSETTLLASGTSALQNDAEVKVWDTANGNLLWSGKHHKNIRGLDISENSFVVSCSEDSTIKVWDAIDGELLWVGFHQGAVNNVKFSKNASKIYSIGTDKTAKIWSQSVPGWIVIE
ncbi:fibronectin type III domain-containing protein [bacterium]|nr:fibronectin type III domain-containing protein [bacterium]